MFSNRGIKGRPVILTVALLAMMLSGCLGPEEDVGPADVKTDGDFAQGRPSNDAEFDFDDVKFDMTGTVTREERFDEPAPPWSLIQDGTMRYRIFWNLTGFVDLGAGEQGTALGETWYSIWLGKPSGEGHTWEIAADGKEPGASGLVEGTTDWKSIWGDYTAIRVTAETVDDANQELVLMQSVEMSVDEAGTWDVNMEQTLDPAFGNAVVRDGVAEDEVNITISTFSLPSFDSRAGQYDAFLVNSAGTHYLATLASDPAAGLSATVVLEADMLDRWYIFIGYDEKDDEEALAESSGFRVLTSSFKS